MTSYYIRFLIYREDSSGSKEMTTICKAKKGEITIKAGEKDVTKIRIKTEDNVKKQYGSSGEDEKAKGLVEYMLNNHKLSGIKYEVKTVKDGISTINMMIDFTKVDSEGISKNGLCGHK